MFDALTAKNRNFDHMQTNIPALIPDFKSLFGTWSDLPQSDWETHGISVPYSLMCYLPPETILKNLGETDFMAT